MTHLVYVCVCVVEASPEVHKEGEVVPDVLQSLEAEIKDL